jgi:hypothetical protein
VWRLIAFGGILLMQIIELGAESSEERAGDSVAS